MTVQIVLRPRRNRILPKMETDHYRLIPTDRETPNHTGLLSVLESVTCSPMLPTNTEVRNRSLSVKLNLLSHPSGETDSHRNAPTSIEMHRTKFDGGFVDQSTYNKYVPVPVATGDGDRPLSSNSD